MLKIRFSEQKECHFHTFRTHFQVLFFQGFVMLSMRKKYFQKAKDSQVKTEMSSTGGPRMHPMRTSRSWQKTFPII